MSNLIILTQWEGKQRFSKVFPGRAARIAATEQGYARIRAKAGKSLQVEMLVPLTNALRNTLSPEDKVLSILELVPGRFAIEVAPKRGSFDTRHIYLYEEKLGTLALVYSPKKELFRDVPMQSLGPNRVALLMATNVVVVDLAGEPRAFYFEETAQFQESALMNGMALYWLDPHPEQSDTLLITCSDGYDSVIETYRVVGDDQIELLDSLELSERAVESAWFASEGDVLGWTCVETNQELRDPPDPNRLLVAGSMGLLTESGEQLGVDIRVSLFYGGVAYEDADIDFYRTCTTWLSDRCYAFRTAVGQLAFCDLDAGSVTLAELSSDERVKNLFSLGSRSFALIESGALYQIAVPGSAKSQSPRSKASPAPKRRAAEVKKAAGAPRPPKMNKQLKLAMEIVENAITTKQTTLNIGEYLAQEVPSRVFEMTWLIELRLNTMSLKVLPAEIGNLTNLEVLVIHGNELESLPSSLGKLVKLRVLNASRNPLRSLPDELRNLISLSELELKSTDVLDFPNCIHGMRALRELCVASPYIRSVPGWLAELSELTTLDFYKAPLSEVPECIRNMKKLESLSLRRTQIEKLPEWLAEVSSLQTLVLDETKIKVVPDWVWNSQTLKVVSIDGVPAPSGFPVEEKRFKINNISVQKFF